MKKILLFAMISGILFSCKNDKGTDDNSSKSIVEYEKQNWSKVNVNAFVKNCVRTAMAGGNDKETATTYCECMQKKVARKYPDAADADKLSLADQDVKDMIADCRKAAGIGTSSSDGWSRKDQLDFVNSCVKEAVKGGMEELDAQSYCDCMQYKLEKKYPDSGDPELLTLDSESPAMKQMAKDCLPED